MFAPEAVRELALVRFAPTTSRGPIHKANFWLEIWLENWLEITF